MMHSRRMACFFLGIWVGAAILMTGVAVENDRSVDRVLSRPSPSALVSLKALGPGGAQMLLRYEAAEQNRWFLRAWGIVQLIGGSLFFLFLLLGTREGKFSLAAVLVMLALVLVQLFLLTPALVSLGRLVDFLPANQPSGDRSRLWVLDGGYALMEALKLAVALLLGASLMRHRRSGDAREELDMIDKPNHRHVNR